MKKDILDFIGLGLKERDVVLIFFGPGLNDGLNFSVSDRCQRHDNATTTIFIIVPKFKWSNSKQNSNSHNSSHKNK